ncbi:MAG: prephenate dehydratase [Cytophagaceae bacterium]|nr:prephenate dehydratase [Cytophagaceae bacterium]MDW8455274.1 prephenate dehydratase [Cytophagaceae bacterium]
MKVAIQGGKASFHDIAARKYFGESIITIPCNTFREVCEQLKKEQCDFAVMAIENSIAASILPNYSLIQSYNLKIIGEIQLRIELNLMALPGVALHQIKKIKSHYMALAQCDEFLAQYPHIKIEEFHDTADSAKDIKENNLTDTAAIASRYAAELYGLDILAESIETVKQNFTRFFILTPDKRHKVPDPDKATLSFRLPHRVGALTEVLQIIVKNNLNLSRIQSLPILGKPDQYTFYIDCEWDNYQDFKNSIGINSIVEDLQILGEYKKGETIYDYSQS